MAESTRKPAHKLTDSDAETMRGRCAVCGPTALVYRNEGGGSRRLTCVTARRQNRGDTPEANRARSRASRERTGGALKPHGLTIPQAREFRAGKVCALCGTGDNLVVDHCHQARKIRDVLCATCNGGLGMFHDDPALLRAAADYLERHAARFALA